MRNWEDNIKLALKETWCEWEDLRQLVVSSVLLESGSKSSGSTNRYCHRSPL